MYKNRTAAKVDANQADIIKELLKIPGVTVEDNHDDIIIGYQGLSFWREIKNPEYCNKDGSIPERIIKPDQKRIRDTFTGDYEIVAEYIVILEGMAKKFDDLGFLRIAKNLRKFKTKG